MLRSAAFGQYRPRAGRTGYEPWAPMFSSSPAAAS
ncbi:hypothetical protein SFR_3745 [Streptomyces sp. FR-008]|nr:hypothetical protein SFR_3745 [Streptomyces sp. FR-008]